MLNNNHNKHSIKIEDIFEDKLIQAYYKKLQAGDNEVIKHVNEDLSEHKEILIVPLGDMHLGSPGTNLILIIFALLLCKTLPNCFVILNGDLVNNANKLGKSSSLQNAMNPPDEWKMIFKLINDPQIQKKILLIVSGNHENGPRMQDVGLDPLAQQLSGTPLYDRYARFSALANLKLKCPYSPEGVANFKLFCNHGSMCSNSSAIDTAINLFTNQGGCDLAIFSHIHNEKMACNGNSFVYFTPSANEGEQYAYEKGLPFNYSNFNLLRVYSTSNLDMLDNTFEENKKILPYKFKVDIQPVCFDEIIKFSKREIIRMAFVERELIKAHNEKISKAVSNIYTDKDKNGGLKK